jgi:type III restriction enzyme
MPLPTIFPGDPYAVLPPESRWYPGTDELNAVEAAQLVPPLVAKIREGVHQWRAEDYPGASGTTRALLKHWFGEPHVLNLADGTTAEFRYYFAQREAVETAIWLYEVEKATDPYSLIRYDSTGLVSTGMFGGETWARYVLKLATGAGKTKVLSLLMAWSYFHKRYEADSTLSRNFLLIAPNIIVLDRLLDDFAGLRIFFADPVIPDNGYAGRNWRDDFQLTLHVQDEVGAVSPEGNLFLTNVHRIYSPPAAPSAQDDDLTSFLLGPKPVTSTTTNTLDVGDVVRSVDDLLVLNDEAHHIHDPSLAWASAIADLDLRMRQRTGHGLSGQFDVTATPRHDNGAVFVQVVCSYPLVEAIRQGVVKTPVVPDEASRAKLQVHASDKISEQYADHIKLGYLEWAKARDRLEPTGRKPLLFVMTTTTQESDEVAEHLELNYPDLIGRVLTIHTNRSGELAAKEVEALREASRKIDAPDSPYRAVVSVLMLREGWDVQNVVSMVGLRPYTATSQVLPEQTLGRGLRRMFRGDPTLTEYVSVVGTAEFLDFVESIRSEGVALDHVPMGGTASGQHTPLLIEVDTTNPDKDVEALDIPLPKLSARITRETRNLEDLDPAAMPTKNIPVVEFDEAEQREIVFKDLDTDETAWSTDLGDEVVATPQAVIAYMTTEIMRRLRLVGGQEILYGKLKSYIRDHLFTEPVDLNDLNVLRNLSEPSARHALIEVFSQAINELTVVDAGSTQVVGQIKFGSARPAVVNNQPYVESAKTIFNKVVGDSGLELRFAQFLNNADDVGAFTRNTRNLHFFIEYVNAAGEISYYYPDFVVRTGDGEVFIVETKGLEDVDVAPKWERLKAWCADATKLDSQGRVFTPLYVTEGDFDDLGKQGATSFEVLATVLADSAPLGVTEAKDGP